MAPVTDQQLADLAPYIGEAKPDGRGEVSMICPIHNDTTRSASLNLNMGAWYCHAGCGGGSVRALIDMRDIWKPVEGRAKSIPLTLDGIKSAVVTAVLASQDELMQDVVGWHLRLLETPRALKYLSDLRGIEEWTIKKAMIGFDGSYFKIPVFSPDREVWNIRTYDPEPRRGRRKIWSLRGFGRARIYPAGVLERAEEGDSILFCEGEWDALLALQAGFLAVTRTDGAGKPWHREWDIGFAGLRVFVCHDRDFQGKKGDKVVTDALRGIAASVHLCELPYRMKEKGGRDITDFLMDADEPGEALGELMQQAKEIKGESSNLGVRTGRAHRSAYAVR